jgi:D-xylose 1-dehydrogenase (NADP+, D-xylono-1,5-lactone-forming)
MGLDHKIRWGLLSTARINRRLLKGARQSEEIEVVAVASRDTGRAEAYAREHAIPRAHGSYEALLGDPEVDAVYVSLPNSMHVEWTIKALEAGKHVLCEKPLTNRPEEAETAFDVAQREGRLLMEAFMYRHNPQTSRLKELLDDGVVGSLRVIRSSFSFTVRSSEDVRLRRALEGGALMDVGCYCVSGARLLAGEPARVSGEQALNEDGVDLRFAGVLRFPGAVLAHFDCALDLPYRAELEVVGDEGWIVVPDPWIVSEPKILVRRGGSIEESRLEEVPVEKVNHYRLELENLGAAIRGEAEPLLGREDAVGQASALAALYRAAEQGRTVTV